MPPPSAVQHGESRKSITSRSNSPSVLNLGPVAALGEHVQPGVGHVAGHEQRGVEGQDAVVAAPGEERRVGDAVDLAPQLLGHQHRLAGLHGLEHGHRGGHGFGIDGRLVALFEHLGVDLPRVVHERGNDRLHLLPARARRGVEGHEGLEALRRPGARERQGPAGRAHEHQPVGALRVIEGELERRAAAEGVADEVGAVDAELVEEAAHRPGVELPHPALDHRLVGAAIAGLVDGQHPEVRSQRREVLFPVAPRRGPRPSAVEEHQRVARPRLVVVEGEVAGLGGPRRGLVGEAFGGERHERVPYSKRTLALPRRSNSARTTSPALMGTDLSRAPDSRISPASRRPP